ncbi:DUF1801 domain-containing protein [Protaetiibacter mangrovi]|uniref:DUF1801 domain-containing protein n=1 Tax=Protaetiibacter mangrovi TaxID=2970926 RepID=A0ABT1ZDP8_9MICO|nr:DUF1801 domain-containing protein [Protaetiibacter mangrovi]MCS0498822.1 DUF1801 domain-containing protein [Protaetiibacter mangrovi]
MAAGIITTSDRELREVLAASTPEVRELTLAARRLILDVLPQTVEVVWPAQRSAGYGTGPKKNSEQFVWLLPFAAHLAMAFPYGVELPDPAGLLGGTGARIRNVRIATAEDLARPELRALVEAATRHRVPPPPAEITVR